MNISLLVLLIVAGVLLLAGFVVGLVFFILFLVKSLGGTTGGWRRLAEDSPDPVVRIQGRWSGHRVLVERANADSGQSARGNHDCANPGISGDAGEVAGGIGVGADNGKDSLRVRRATGVTENGMA